ncbi:hypothetical protein V8C42DRAFT_360312 [Trichoderma barbatum]
MATLAAIPEATSCLLDRNRIRYRDIPATTSVHRQRPKSRVVILSKHSSREHTPPRKPSPPMASPGSVYSSDARQAPAQHDAEMPSYEVHRSPPGHSRGAQPDNHTTHDARATFRGASMRSLDTVSSLDDSWGPSEPSVDLDSFPLPPPKNPLHQSRYAANLSAAATNPSRNHASVLSKPGTSARFASTSFSSPPARRRPHACMHRSPRSSHRLLDGAADFASLSKHTSIDAALVEAISRNVCQQLRLFTAISKTKQEKRASRASREAPASRHGNHSRITHQSDPLDRLTERRHGQPQGAKVPWQLRNPPTTPTKSIISLHTVSPLLPFRPEFKAAGLAVTSKDQKRSFPAYIARLISSKPNQKRTIPSRGKHSTVPKFDGLEEEDSSESSMSQISFAPSQDMDEWRFALIDEAPVRKQKRRPANEKRKARRRWFPCFARDEDSISGDAVSRMPRDSPPTPPPKPTPLVLPQRDSRENGIRPRADSSPRSPRHNSLETRDAEKRAYEFGSQSRQPAKSIAYAEVCHGGHYDGESSSNEHTCMRPRVKRAQTTQNPPARHFNSQGSRNYQRPYQSLPIQRVHRGLSEGTRFKTYIKPTQHRPNFDPDHVGVCCRSSRGVSSQANAPPNIPTRTSSIPESLSTLEDDREGDDCNVIDRDVLRGLHIAASAACDEEVDAFVRNRTGLRLRRFLADLRVLETLRDIQPVEGRSSGARRKRSTLRQLKQQVRRSRDVRGLGMAV